MRMKIPKQQKIYHGRSFCANAQYYNSHTQQIPKDVIGYIITFYPYSWLSVNKYFRSVSLQVLPLEDKEKVMRCCCIWGYLDLLNQIMVKYGQFVNNIYKVDSCVDPSMCDYNMAMKYASRNGQLAVVERLLQDERVDPSDRENYAIRHASQRATWQLLKDYFKMNK